MKVSSLTALPIMIFGGSPMRVAVPPIFEAKICVIRKGTGLTQSVGLSYLGKMESSIWKAFDLSRFLFFYDMTPEIDSLVHFME
ncbi:hypothetical protein FPZ49_35025 [Paenibacillus cremeus]|uniref:Uncharacterized protein n=1 Tax=Paenibacillus cremeus TaxID=2163881 RepID=A0A559JCF6_9BACL|nr:hypothetical protein FPZ49_35025 [Paenibacillus cremeus]